MNSLNWNDITLCFSSAFDSAVYILKCFVYFKQLHEQFNFLHQRCFCSFVYSNYEHMVKKSPYVFNDNGDIWIKPNYQTFYTCIYIDGILLTTSCPGELCAMAKQRFPELLLFIQWMKYPIIPSIVSRKHIL